MAWPMSRRPPPWAYTLSSGWGLAVPISTALIRPGVQLGQRWARMAAAPATCGVAIEVPVARVYHWPTGSSRAVPAARAATMSTPGAVMSGFMA